MSVRALAQLCFLGAALAALAAAAWLIPEQNAASEAQAAPLIVCVLDVSLSERRTRPNWSNWARAEVRKHAEEALACGSEFAVVRFAESVELVGGATNPAEWLDRLDGRAGWAWVPTIEGDAGFTSSLEPALTVVEGLAQEQPHSSVAVWLLSSGGYSGADPHAAWQQLTQLGARLEHVQPPAPDFPDVELIGATLPEGLEPDAPASVRVELAWQPGSRPVQELTLRILVEQGGIALPHEHQIALPATADRWEVNVPLGVIGFGALEVTVDALVRQGERVIQPTPENDRVTARTFVEGEHTIGLVRVADDAEVAESWLLPNGLSAMPGLIIRALTPSELPGRLESLDAFVTYDIDPSQLPAEFLVPWVERGGGWLATAGSRAFRDTDDGLEELACLERVAASHTERDVILMVDGSGSMEGAAFVMVKSAGVGLAEAALAGDAVSLRFFTTILDEPLLLKARGAQSDVGAAAARALLGARVPGRSTYIAESLETLGFERLQQDREALVLMLTDGHERANSSDPERDQRLVRAQLAESDTRLVVIAVGDKPNLEYLSRFLPEGEDVLVANELDDLTRIFARQIEDERQLRADPPVGVLSVAPPKFDLAPSALQPLDSLWKTIVRPPAALEWITDDGDPVLAWKRVGLGRVAQLATHPRSGWADAWLEQRGLGEPAAFGPLLRWLARRPRGVVRPQLSRHPRGLELAGVADDTPAVLEIEVAPIDGASVARATFLREVEPAGFARPGVRFAAVDDRDWWNASTLQAGLVLRFPEPIGALMLERPRPTEFQLAPRFSGQASLGGPTESVLGRRSRPLRASRLGSLSALLAAALATLGLLLALRSSVQRGASAAEK